MNRVKHIGSRSMVVGLKDGESLQLADNWSVFATPEWYVINKRSRCKQIVSREFFYIAMLSFVVIPHLGLEIRMMGQQIMLLRGY
jgi:hypothetical protein